MAVKAAALFLLFCAPALADMAACTSAFDAKAYDVAFRECSPLANQGNAYAQFTLGVLYYKGQGARQDYKEAVRWYRLAADQGFSNAQGLLGLVYGQGQGVAQDYKEAVRWYRLAADQGNADAQGLLGLTYEQGQGVPQDYIQAHMWFNLAGAGGSTQGVTNRDLVAQKMTPEQIAEAQRLAREWKPKTSR